MIRDQFTGVRPAQLFNTLFNKLRDGCQRLILFKLLDFQCRLSKAGGAQLLPLFCD